MNDIYYKYKMNIWEDIPERWTDLQKALFMRIMRHMERNQWLFCHLDAKPVPIEYWATTCWNAAYFAAHCTGDEAETLVHLNEDGEQIGEEFGKNLQS